MKMRFSEYHVSYDLYETWKEICPEGRWRTAEPALLDGLIPSDLLNKTNSVFVMGSASAHGSVFLANLNRVDMAGSAIDQQPFVVAFNHAGSTATGGFVHHGDWPGRTTKPGEDFFKATAASGIQAYYPLEEMPTAASGKLEDLKVASQNEAWWNTLSLLRDRSE